MTNPVAAQQPGEAEAFIERLRRGGWTLHHSEAGIETEEEIIEAAVSDALRAVYALRPVSGPDTQAALAEARMALVPFADLAAAMDRDAAIKQPDQNSWTFGLGSFSAGDLRLARTALASIDTQSEPADQERSRHKAGMNGPGSEADTRAALVEAREALAPFADFAASYDLWADDDMTGVAVPAGDFRHARTALASIDRALSSPATGEPVAWRHEIKEPDHDWTTMFSGSSDNPWSHWVATHQAGCEYRVTPLYSSPPTAMPMRATKAMADSHDQIVAEPSEHFGSPSHPRTIWRHALEDAISAALLAHEESVRKSEREAEKARVVAWLLERAEETSTSNGDTMRWVASTIKDDKHRAAAIRGRE